jgi:hypothetical protein
VLYRYLASNTTYQHWNRLVLSNPHTTIHTRPEDESACYSWSLNVLHSLICLVITAIALMKGDTEDDHTRTKLELRKVLIFGIMCCNNRILFETSRPIQYRKVVRPDRGRLIRRPALRCFYILLVENRWSMALIGDVFKILNIVERWLSWFVRSGSAAEPSISTSGRAGGLHWWC